EGAPRVVEEKRRALLGEIERAQASRRAAADQLAEGETTLAEADRMQRSALEAVSAAREEAARAEERCEGGKRRLGDLGREIHDMLEVDPPDAPNLAALIPDNPLPALPAL